MKATQLEITIATREDYTDFCSIKLEGDLLHAQVLPWKFKKPKKCSLNYFEGLLNDKTNILFLAKEGNRSIGFIHAIIKKIGNKEPTAKQRTNILIDSIAVLKKHQGKGIGKLLMQKVEERAKSKKIDDIELNVFSFNENAIEFYKNSDTLQLPTEGEKYFKSTNLTNEISAKQFRGRPKGNHQRFELYPNYGRHTCRRTSHRKGQENNPTYTV